MSMTRSRGFSKLGRERDLSKYALSGRPRAAAIEELACAEGPTWLAADAVVPAEVGRDSEERWPAEEGREKEELVQNCGCAAGGAEEAAATWPEPLSDSPAARGTGTGGSLPLERRLAEAGLVVADDVCRRAGVPSPL